LLSLSPTLSLCSLSFSPFEKIAPAGSSDGKTVEIDIDILLFDNCVLDLAADGIVPTCKFIRGRFTVISSQAI
jgi:hypothetical protein